MPRICIETNVPLNDEAARDLARKASALAAGAVGKDEQWVQACVYPGLALTHGGSADPAAYVTLKSIGLPEAACPTLSAKICAFLAEELNIPADRTYIEFTDLARARFGWNGKTFG